MNDPDAYRHLLDYAQDKIVVLDAAGTFTYVNEASDRILGFDPAALVGDEAFAYIHPDDRDRVRELFEEAVAAGDAFDAATVEYRHRTADDGWVWLESRLSNPAEPSVDGWVVSSREITDRIRAEKKHEESETRLREIATKSSDALWSFSADWSELLFINRAYEDIYGQSIERIREEPPAFIECVHPEDRDSVRDAMRRLSRGEHSEVEYRVNPAEDYGRWVWVQAEPVFEGGEVERIVGFSRDVTDRRRRERQLSVMDTLLRHNLRNDLNVVVGHAEDIAESADEASSTRAETISEVARDLLKTADKQREIIDLLTRPVTPESLDLVAIIEETVASVKAEYPDAEFHVDVPEDLHVHTLPDLHTGVRELLENAAKHAIPEEPEVWIRAERRDDTVTLEIEDECPPIEEYEYRVLTGEREMDETYHSSGLGLWLVHWVVDLSNGSVEFRPGDPVGNTITVNLRAA